MSAFKGSFVHSIDNKGRINIPAKLRKYLNPEANDTFVITRGFDRCIFAYPYDEWSNYEKQIRMLRTSDANSRYVMRHLLQFATEVQLDAQSRIMLPQKLIHLAEIKNEALILGVLDHLEIWNPDIYENYIQQQDASYEEVAEKVFQINNIQT